MYRAFLSYSHADKEIAHKLHSWLEAFRVPTGLPGAEEYLRPIFLDEAELGAAPALSDKLVGALDASQALIVVASPVSATSSWVAKEILHFRSTKPDKPCLAIIVAGQPFAIDPLQECFAEPLKYSVRDGKLTSERRDPLASDVTKQGQDGAFLRLAAGLIGANFSDLFDRHAAREAAIIKRQRRALAKAYTIPAREAASVGHHERVLKYLLAYVLEADDAEWTEAPELEALAHDAGRALPCRAVLRVNGPGIVKAIICPSGRTVASLLNNGQCLLWDISLRRFTAMVGDRNTPRILCAAFSPDGAVLLTGAKDGQVDLWDLAHSAHTRVGSLDGPITHVQFVDNGTLVAAATEEQYRLWNGSSRAAVGGVPAFAMTSKHLAISPDGWTVATVGDAGASRSERNRRLTLWNARTGLAVGRLMEHLDTITCLAFSPDGGRLVTGAQDQTGLVWDVGSRKAMFPLIGHGAPNLTERFLHARRNFSDDTLLTLAAHGGRITNVAFSPDGTRILTASADKTARLWDAGTGAMLVTLAGHTAPLSSARFSPDGARVVTTAGDWFNPQASDRVVRVWNALTGKEVSRLVGHDYPVTTASFDPAGEQLLSISADGSARIWAVAVANELVRLTGHEGQIVQASYAADGRQVLSRSLHGNARLWDARTGEMLVSVGTLDCAAIVTCLSPSGRRMATATSDGTVRIHDTTTGIEVATLKGAAGKAHDLALSPDDMLVAIATVDGGLRAVHLESRSVQEYAGHDDAQADLLFSHDNTRLIATDSNGNVVTWDLKTGQFSVRPTGFSGRILDTALSPDGTLLAIASGKTPAVLDLMTGTAIASLKGHQSTVSSIVFSPEGKRLVTASEDGSARVWNLADAMEITQLQHADEVRCAVFDASGSRVITASKDNTARIWDAVSGRQLACLTGHGAPAGNHDGIPEKSDPAFGMAVSSLLTMTGTKAAITAAHFSPDGRCALTASVDGTLVIWDVTHTTLRGAALSAWICSRMSHGVGRLTDEDISDVLLKDVLPTDRDGDLAAAVLARWPHLGDIDVPEPLPSRLDTLLDPKPNQSPQSEDRDDPPADGSLAEPAQVALTSITPAAIAKGPSRRAIALIALTCLGAILVGWFLLGRA